MNFPANSVDLRTWWAPAFFPCTIYIVLKLYLIEVWISLMASQDYLLTTSKAIHWQLPLEMRLSPQLLYLMSGKSRSHLLSLPHQNRLLCVVLFIYTHVCVYTHNSITTIQFLYAFVNSYILRASILYEFSPLPGFLPLAHNKYSIKYFLANWCTEQILRGNNFFNPFKNSQLNT